jgi:hypothetical protein
MESTTFNAKLNSVQGPGIIPQILLGLTLVVVMYLVFIFVEVIYKYFNRLRMNRTELLPNTYATDDKSITIIQNPNDKHAKSVALSSNERTGIEFSYSFYLNVHPSTFRTEKGLLHIFHKGFSNQFPLLSPGVYMRSDTNTLRVYINTYKTWNNYVEVDNFPVGKWVHVGIVCKENSLEIFINGNLARKLPFEGFQPYQNYEDIICFSPSTDADGVDVFGSMKGMLSKLNYFNYALCYSEINSLMNEGPSSKLTAAITSTNIPPYLDDTWWSQGH